MTTPQRSRRSLDHAIVKGVAWTGAASWIAQALTWLSTLLVVRLLKPDDYGIVELAAVYLGLVTMLSDFGVGTAVVTMRELSARHIAQLNSVVMLVALCGLVLSWALAAPLATLLESPRLPTLIQVMSTGLIVTAIGAVPTAMIQKALRFRFLAAAQVVQALVAACSTLILALLGGGYWALALGPLVGRVALSLVVTIGAPCGYIWPEWHGLKPALRFSRAVFLEGFCWHLYTGSDRFVISKWIGESAVGLYAVASSFGLMAVEKVTVLVLRIAPAAFSEVQKDPASLRRYLLSLTEGLSIVTFPISIGIALVAEDTVHLLFGPQWAGAVAPLRMLGIFAAYNSVTVLVSRVLAAIGDVRYAMHVGMLTLAVLPVSFMIATRWGLAGVAAMWVVVYPLTQFPLFLRLFKRIDLTSEEYLKSLWPALSGVSVMTVAILLVGVWPALHGLPRTADLALRICVGVTSYMLTILVFHSERVRRFKSLMQEMRTKNESDPPESIPENLPPERPRLIS